MYKIDQMYKIDKIYIIGNLELVYIVNINSNCLMYSEMFKNKKKKDCRKYVFEFWYNLNYNLLLLMYLCIYRSRFILSVYKNIF